MEETTQKTSFFGKVAGFFGRHDEDDDFEYEVERKPSKQEERTTLRLHHKFAYHVTIRKNIVKFDDAVEAAEGLKRGEAQILNLSQAPVELREIIRHFICGCKFMVDAHLEEVADHTYLLAPAHAQVESAQNVPNARREAR